MLKLRLSLAVLVGRRFDPIRMLLGHDTRAICGQMWYWRPLQNNGVAPFSSHVTSVNVVTRTPPSGGIRVFGGALH